MDYTCLNCFDDIDELNEHNYCFYCELECCDNCIDLHIGICNEYFNYDF